MKRGISRGDGLVARVAEGALGGFVGAKVLEQEMKLAGRLPEGLQPPEPRESPGIYMAHQLERLRRRPSSQRTPQTGQRRPRPTPSPRASTPRRPPPRTPRAAPRPTPPSRGPCVSSR